ncbi:MAG: DUF4274 domain-containing protein [Myxococcales bacterium]|nr:DUF4274 domain-containing protein [Myxococcales bacterium]
MKLTPEQEQRVEAALEVQTNTAKASRAVRLLKTPEELDALVRRYNINDGCHYPLVYLRSPLCDAGTALYIYWQLEGLLFRPPESRRWSDDPDFDWVGLIELIERRFARYPRRSVEFDPAAYFKELGGLAVVVRAIRTGKGLYCPPIMREAVVVPRRAAAKAGAKAKPATKRAVKAKPARKSATKPAVKAKPARKSATKATRTARR